jgi:hypothetical protein
MPSLPPAPQVLDRHYLELRCGLLDMAAALDRLERAAGFSDLTADPRLARIHEGLRILASSGVDRAERLQLLFSDSYDADWNR